MAQSPTLQSADYPEKGLGQRLAAGLLQVLTLSMFLLFTVNHSNATEPSAHNKQLQAIRLAQEHYFLGPTVLTICPSALRLDCTKHMGFCLVANAPDWTVTVYRDDDKAIKSLSLKEFDNAGMMPQYLQTSRPRFVPSTARPYNFKFYGLDAKRVSNKYQTQEYLPIQGIASPQVERIVFAAYRLPTGGGLPLRYIGTIANRDYFTGKDQRGQRENSLTTSSLRHVIVARDFFAPPANYHQAKLMQDVVVSAKTRAQSSDFQNVFDIANPLKKDKNKP
jgi:hypothetical protein